MKIYFAGAGHDLTEKSRRKFLRKVRNFLLSYLSLSFLGYNRIIVNRYKYIVKSKKRKNKEK